MTIKQLSIFLENKSGRLTEILDVLGSADIRIIAATVADTSEYGILRLITTNTTKALELLKAENIGANLSDVIALSCDSKANEFSKQLKYFKNAGISIEYMYCFSVRSKAFLILRTDNCTAAQKVMEDNRQNYISEEELIKL